MKRLRSKITKRILGIILIMGCSGIFLNGYVGIGEPVYATESVQNTDTTDTQSGIETMSLWQILNLILKVIYLLLWPLLVVAGLALDNTLVYASIFQLDAPLWKFWNMMKNFANFTLGFMVLFAIIKSILTNSGAGSAKDEKSPLGIIKKTLIAGVLIQASWFLMAALVDISTIATYAVGGLPLSVLKDTDIGSQKILSVNSSIDLNKFDSISDEGSSFRVSYSTTYRSGGVSKKVELSPCRIEEGYIVGRQYTEAKFRNSEIFGGGQSACVALGNQIVIYNEFPALATKEGPLGYKIGIEDMLGYGLDRDTYGDKVAYGSRGWLQACGYIIPLSPDENIDIGTCGELFPVVYAYISNNSASYDIADYGRLQANQKPTLTPRNNVGLGMKGGTTRFNSDNVVAMTISDLINKSKGFVGPLVTMYSSLLNFAQLTDTSVTTIGETSGIFLIKTGVAIALFFPLLALAVVLIARVGLLWLFIVASPFIIIKESFKDFIKMDKLDKYLSVKSVIGIVFAPVVTVAALSLSLIFMTTLISSFKSDNQQISHNMAQSLTLEPIEADPGNTAFQVAGSSAFEFKNFTRGGSLDWFSWLVVNFFAVGLLRTILFAAIKANALGESIGAPIQKFGSNFFQTLPILPIGEGGRGVGVGSAYNVVSQIPNRKLEDRQAEDTRLVTELLATPKETTTLSTTDINTVATNLSTMKATEAFTAAGVKISPETAITTYGTQANLTGMYDVINKMKQPEEKTAAIENAGEIFGGKDWFTKETTKREKAEITTNFTKILANADTSDKFINTLNNATGTDKEAIEKYFTTMNTKTYEVALGNIAYIVTQDLSATDKKYTIKENTVQS